MNTYVCICTCARENERECVRMSVCVSVSNKLVRGRFFSFVEETEFVECEC